MPFVVTHIDLEDVTLNECYTEKDKYYIIFTYMWNLKRKQQNVTKQITKCNKTEAGSWI